jgi:hypothetical protein
MTTPIKAVLATGFAQPRFTIKRGDTIPPIVAQIVDPYGASGLTGAMSVELRYWPSSCCSLPPESSVRTVNCTVSNASIGVVSAFLSAEDTAVAGEYEMEFRVTYPNGARFTAPNDGNLELVIVDHP